MADARLVGRESELATIQALVRRTRDECQPTAAVVLGVAGIGKTRLVSEALKAPGALRVLRMAGFEPEQRVPLGSVASVLRELAKSDRVLATLLTQRPDDADGIDSIRIFESAYRTMSESAPVLLLIDDVQWIDELSAAFVHYVVRAGCADRTGLMAVCAARPATQTPGLARSLRTLFDDDETGFAEINLEPLTKAEGVELARVYAPGLDDAAAADVWATSGGSPFWIQTAARAQAKPERPAAVIASSLRQLSPDAASTLAALVVTARPIPTEELSELLGWPAARATEALAELVNRGLAIVTAGQSRTAHDLVRDAAFAALPAAQTTALHAKYAGTLRRRADGDLQLLMEALGHADAAGVVTLDLALEIAQSPQRRLLGLPGLGRLAIIADRPTTDETKMWALELVLAQLAEELSDHEQACDRWSRLAESLPASAQRANAAVKAAKHAHEVGRSERVTTMLGRARREPAADDDWILVAADALDYSRLVWLEHDTKSAQPYRQRAINRSRELVAAVGSMDALTGVQRPDFRRS